MSDRPLMQRLKEDAAGAVSDLIYEKVNDLLGAGDQLFTMEFPARPLNGATYTYDADNVYSTITRPIAVQEAEFVLSDSLYDTVPIVQAGNGEKLSVVYDELINNYVPKLDFLQDFVTDKNTLREWLLTEVDDVEFDENGKSKASSIKISRMELCRKLYGEYLKQHNEWSQEKNKAFNGSKDTKAIEAYAQWVTTEAVVRDAQLNNLFNDAVVRGNLHEVMTILGFLNVESPAEALEKAKQNMRASVKRTLDGSGEVYPVQFQPTNWFKALKPNLNPKDLTMSSEALVAEYRAKLKSKANLEAQLTELEEKQISQEEIDRLKVQVEEARNALNAADAEVMRTCGQGAKDALHLAIKIYKQCTDPMAAFNSALQNVKEAREKSTMPSGADKHLYDLLGDVSDAAIDGMSKSYEALAGALNAMEKSNAAQLEYTAAKTQNLDALKSTIKTQLRDLQADVDYLKPLVAGTLAEINAPSENAPADEAAEAKAPLLPAAADDNVSDSTFMDVVITSESITKRSQESSSQASSQSSWKVGGWFFSAGHSSSSSSSSHSKASAEDTSKIEIGFRVTKVAIERGGWFNPSLFKMSHNFYRLADSRCAKGINKDDIRLALQRPNSDSELKKLVTYTNDKKETVNYLLPSFPTAFVIAKDITVRVRVTAEEVSESKAYATSQSATSGGFFGFSASSGSNSQSTSESSYVGSRNQFIYIRIPGPQVLGWFQQLVPADGAEAYKPLGGNPFKAQEVLQNLHCMSRSALPAGDENVTDNEKRGKQTHTKSQQDN